MFGSTEIIVIGLILFLLFGAASIPKFARSLGEARKEFKKGIDELDSVDKNDKSDDSPKS